MQDDWPGATRPATLGESQSVVGHFEQAYPLGRDFGRPPLSAHTVTGA